MQFNDLADTWPPFGICRALKAVPTGSAEARRRPSVHRMSAVKNEIAVVTVYVHRVWRVFQSDNDWVQRAGADE